MNTHSYGAQEILCLPIFILNNWPSITLIVQIHRDAPIRLITFSEGLLTPHRSLSIKFTSHSFRPHFSPGWRALACSL